MQGPALIEAPINTFFSLLCRPTYDSALQQQPTRCPVPSRTALAPQSHDAGPARAVPQRQTEAPPHQLHHLTVGRAGESFRENPLPRCVHERGAGHENQPDGSQSAGMCMHGDSVCLRVACRLPVVGNLVLAVGIVPRAVVEATKYLPRAAREYAVSSLWGLCFEVAAVCTATSVCSHLKTF